MKNSLTLQKWTLYSDIYKHVGWYRFKGTTINEKGIDLFTNKEWNDDEGEFKNYQYGCWQNLIQYLVFKQPYYNLIEKELVDYYCRANADQVQCIELIQFRKINQTNVSVIDKESKEIKFCI